MRSAGAYYKLVYHEICVYIEEYARDLIGQEELHSLELKKMLRDFEMVDVRPREQNST